MPPPAVNGRHSAGGAGLVPAAAGMAAPVSTEVPMYTALPAVLRMAVRRRPVSVIRGHGVRDPPDAGHPDEHAMPGARTALSTSGYSCLHASACFEHHVDQSILALGVQPRDRDGAAEAVVCPRERMERDGEAH